MFISNLLSLILAAAFGGWEVLTIVGLLLVLYGARKLPDISKGIADRLSDFGRALDQQAHDAGRSAGGIYGKPAAEALTPDNQTAELYNPAVFHRDSRKGRPLRQRLMQLWHRVLAWLRIKQ